NLRVRLPDPNWRESLVLATGMVSWPGYPDSSPHLVEVFYVLLNTPDPAGDFLPRHSLLAAAACAECERVPFGTGQRIAHHLLSLYAQREGSGKFPVLRARIQQAFAILQNSCARDE